MRTAHKGFRVKPVYTYRKPKFFTLAREKLSFTVAAFTVTAFIMGNMVGQHGWYAFWRTVLGEGDDALIVFDGMVSPVEYIPDYRRWMEYGGNAEEHTYASVPRDLLVPLPAYRASDLKHLDSIPFESKTLAQLAYSMGNLSSYASGDDHSGSHTGVDIRLPTGTPIRSIANGIVEKIVTQNYGFGHYIVVRYPNVPDPTADDGTSTYYATYAHLSSILVRDGQVVRKGETIGYSGKTGLASGPHLHFQIDTEEAPWHPYWAFTSSEASAAGMSFLQAVNAGLNQSQASLYTVSPVLLVQSFHSYSAPTLATNGNAALSGVVAQHAASSAPSQSPAEKLTSRASARLAARQALADARNARIAARIAAAGERAVSKPVAAVTQVLTASHEAAAPVPAKGTNQDVFRIEIKHSGKVELGWQTMTLRAVDREGRLVKDPAFTGTLYVRAEFGEADIQKSELTARDFVNGEAVVRVLVRGRKTVYFVTRGAFETQSAPMVYER